jgi:hypothetical protein
LRVLGSHKNASSIKYPYPNACMQNAYKKNTITVLASKLVASKAVAVLAKEAKEEVTPEAEA